MFFNSTVFLKLSVLVLFLNTPLLALECIRDNEIDDPEYSISEKIKFIKYMRALAGETFASDSGDYYLFTTAFGRFLVGNFSPRASDDGGFLARYRFFDDVKSEWDEWLETGKSLYNLNYSRNGNEVLLCNKIDNYELIWYSNQNSYLLNIYKLNGLEF